MHWPISKRSWPNWAGPCICKESGCRTRRARAVERRSYARSPVPHSHLPIARHSEPKAKNPCIYLQDAHGRNPAAHLSLLVRGVRCRAVALRGRRSLRDGYTGFALGLPLVGAKIYASDQRERHPKEYTSHEVTALRVGGPAGRPESFSPPKSGFEFVDTP